MPSGCFSLPLSLSVPFSTSLPPYLFFVTLSPVCSHLFERNSNTVGWIGYFCLVFIPSLRCGQWNSFHS